MIRYSWQKYDHLLQQQLVLKCLLALCVLQYYHMRIFPPNRFCKNRGKK